MKKIDEEKLERIKILLAEQEDWPLNYTFKFIIPVQQIANILTLFPQEEGIATKPSSKGNYMSVTLLKRVDTPDEIIEIYRRVSVIDGLMAL